MELKMRHKCAIAHTHSDIWKITALKEIPCYPTRQTGPSLIQCGEPVYLSLGSIQRSAASRKMPITKLLGQNMRVSTHKNVFIYSTLASYIEIEAQILHAGCITAFSEWLVQVLMQTEGCAVWVCGSSKSTRCDMDWGHCYVDCNCIYPIHKTLKHKCPPFAYCINCTGFLKTGH